MNLEKYKFTDKSENKKVSYFFVSTGTKGDISKVVYFQPREDNDFEYNLALADINPSTGKPDFEASSNNGDIKKVMATILGIGIDFFKTHPNDIVSFTGNQERKTRFYQRIIKNYYDELSQYFIIYGVLSFTEIEYFDLNKEYFGFFFKLKKIIKL